MEKNIIYIKLMNRPISGEGNNENKVNGRRFDNTLKVSI